MKIAIQTIWRDKVCHSGIKAFSFLIILTFTFLVFSLSRLPPEVPLFYSRPWGEEQLANWLFLWLLPVGATLICLLNFSLASFLIKKEALLARMLILNSVLVYFLTSLAVFKIINLVT